MTPGGERTPVADEGDGVLEVREQGFYEIRGAASDVTVVASNVDPAEGDLTPLDPKEIVAAATGATSADGARAAAVPQGPETQERNQRLWWYLLVAGVLLLGLDTLLSNRLAKA
jgi:hypothetical protein